MKLILALSLALSALTISSVAKADEASDKAMRAMIQERLKAMHDRANKAAALPEKKEKKVDAPVPGNVKIKSTNRTKTIFIHEIG